MIGFTVWKCVIRLKFILQVGLAFCTLYTFTYRTTWCVFPFTIVAMSWCKVLTQSR